MKQDLPLNDPTLQDALVAEAALVRAQRARRQGDLGLALEHARQAWATAPVDGLRASAGWLACFCHHRLGQAAALRKRGEAVLPILQDRMARMVLLRWLSLAHAQAGHIDTARRHGLQALQLADAQGDEAERALARQALARADLQAGDPAGAEVHLRDALSLAESQPQAWPLLSVLQDQAEAALDFFHCAALQAPPADGPGSHGARPPIDTEPTTGEAAAQALDRAVDAALRGQTITRRLGEAHIHALLDGWLGEALMHQGQSAAAWPRLATALCEALAHDRRAHAHRLMVAMAEAQARGGDGAAALERLDALQASLGEPGAPDASGAPQLPPVTAWRAERLRLALMQAQVPPPAAAAIEAQRRTVTAMATGLQVAQGLDSPPAPR